MVMFPTSVAHTELVQLAASRTDNRRSEPTEQARFPWLAPLKARPQHLYCMRLHKLLCISMQLRASVLGFTLTLSTLFSHLRCQCYCPVSWHTQSTWAALCLFSTVLHGSWLSEQNLYICMGVHFVHQQSLYICMGSTFCTILSCCSSPLNCICGPMCKICKLC